MPRNPRQDCRSSQAEIRTRDLPNVNTIFIEINYTLYFKGVVTCAGAAHRVCGAQTEEKRKRGAGGVLLCFRFIQSERKKEIEEIERWTSR
jgi:hypothetical protein